MLTYLKKKLSLFSWESFPIPTPPQVSSTSVSSLSPEQVPGPLQCIPAVGGPRPCCWVALLPSRTGTSTQRGSHRCTPLCPYAPAPLVRFHLWELDPQVSSYLLRSTQVTLSSMNSSSFPNISFPSTVPFCVSTSHPTCYHGH